MLNRTRRQGFSLIELLIVVAIIAALVGVAVPFFQDNLSEAQRTKAGQDLEVVKKAISLYDARESRPLVGTSLDPLLGRYMQEIPRDPWGNDYLFDGAAGLLASYGADALPDGSGGDTDITVFTKPPLLINRVQYQGAWGRPRRSGVQAAAPPLPATTFVSGNKFIITLTKPSDITQNSNASLGEIMLLTNPGGPSSAATGMGGAISLINPDLGNGTIVWDSSTNTTNTPTKDPLDRPEVGVFVVYCLNDMFNTPAAQSVTPTMALDLACINATDIPGFDTSLGDTAGGAIGSVGTDILESHYSDGVSPLDTDVYGDQSNTLYSRPPQPMELVNGSRRGVKLEKY